MVDNSIILKGPHVMQLFLADILMWGKSENTIRVVAETLTLVESQELEVSALVVLQGNFELGQGSFLLLVSLKWLDASIVLPNEALELSGSIGQLGGSLGKDLVGVRLVHVIGLGLASLAKLVSLNE